MKYSVMTMIFIAVLLLLSGILGAHGVQGTVKNGALVVTATYDTGEPMSYAKANITAPGANLPFQSGRTDRNGRFCFFPDIAGEWEVVIDDEMGHRLSVNVPVDEQLVWKEQKDTAATMETAFSRYEKALMGLCVLFGVFGIFSWWKGKRHRPIS